MLPQCLRDTDRLRQSDAARPTTHAQAQPGIAGVWGGVAGTALPLARKHAGDGKSSSGYVSHSWHVDGGHPIAGILRGEAPGHTLLCVRRIPGVRRISPPEHSLRTRPPDPTVLVFCVCVYPAPSPGLGSVARTRLARPLSPLSLPFVGLYM